VSPWSSFKAGSTRARRSLIELSNLAARSDSGKLMYFALVFVGIQVAEAATTECGWWWLARPLVGASVFACFGTLILGLLFRIAFRILRFLWLVILEI
jgi:hypothetical protein